MNITKSQLNALMYKVNGAAIEVHKNLGPGLLESVYHKCLAHELHLQKISYESELKVPVDYKGINVSTDLRCDFYIGNCLVVELKSVKEILPVHEAQLMTYMKLLKAPKGLLINFNVNNLYYQGQKSYVNQWYRALPE